MSIDALSWAFNLALPNSGVKLTLLAIANYADDKGEAFPSQKSIALKTCLSERAIRTHLVTLEALGVITRISRKRANGSFTSDLFKVNIGMDISSGKISQRQILPAAENDTIQRQILPNPAAKSATPESSLNTTITKSNLKKSKPKKTAETTLSEFIAQCNANNEQAIREDDPIFSWAKTVALPEDMLYLGWTEFKNLQAADKKQADWRATFRIYVKRDYLHLWAINKDGEYYLTLRGKQLERELNGAPA